MGPITLECGDLACALGSTGAGAIDALRLRHPALGWVALLYDAGCALVENRLGASDLILPGGTTRRDDPASQPGATRSNPTEKDQLAWRILDRSPGSARLVCELGSGSVRLGAIQRVELAPGRVTIDQSITNLGDAPTPCWMARTIRVPRILVSTSDTLDIGRDGKGAACSWIRSGVTLHIDHSGGFGHIAFQEPESGVGAPNESLFVGVTLSTIDPTVLGRGDEREHAPTIDPGQTLGATIALGVTADRTVTR